MTKTRLFLFRIISYAGAAFVISSCAASFLFIIARGLPYLNTRLFFGDTPPMAALLGLRPVWEGIWPAFAGTLCLVLLTVLLAALPGIGCGIYLARFAGGRLRKNLSLAIGLLAGVPSIVMGLFGFVLILTLRHIGLNGATTCILLAAFCLALLVIPALAVATRSAVESLPHSLSLTCAALGFSESQSLRRVLLPAAARGILGGMILAMGRAAEDTAVIMLTGAVVNSGLPAGLASKFEALPFFIYYSAAQYRDEDELGRGFGAALVLLMLSALLTFGAYLCQRAVTRRFRGDQ